MNKLKTQKTIGTEMLRFLALIFFVAVLFSCTKTESEIKTINVLELEESSLSISEIADDIEYIPLANDSLLAYIMKVVYCDGDYFVKDNKSKFLRFNEKGELLNPIGRRGRGPGEYNYASNFVIHPDKNIYISGGKEGKIMVFSPEGKFIRTFDISQKYPSNFELYKDKFLLFYGPGAEHISENMEIVDTNGASLSTYINKYKFERGKAVIGFSAECLMYIFGGKLHYKEIFSDTIFTLYENERIPKIILNSGERKFTTDARTKMIQEASLDPGGTNKTWLYSLIHNNLIETQKYLLYSYAYDKKTRTLVYNKSNYKTVEIDNKSGMENDLDGGPNIQLKMNKDDNTVFSWINAIDLKMYVESDAFKNSTPKYPEKKKELEQLANSLNENDNPVLMRVKLKE